MRTATTSDSRFNFRRSLATACLAGSVVACTPGAVAQEALPDDPTPSVEPAMAPDIQTIFPQRRWRRPLAQHWQPVEVKAVDADVVIDGDVATTTLAITLFNPSSGIARCELAVPVPGEAAISAFSLDGLECDPPARLLPRDEARAAFEAIVRKMIDPGLLEFAGYGLITSSVFPVPAHGEQTFRLTYEHVLDGDGSSIVYELPRSSSIGNAPDWDIDIEIRGGAPVLSAFSTSHDAAVEINDDGSATLDGRGLQKPGPFRIVAMREQGDGPAMSVLTCPDPASAEGGFFMLVMAAPEHASDAAGVGRGVAREVTIVLDRSGSMQGEKFAQATEAAKQVINALGPDESIRIVDYSSGVSTFSVDAGTPDMAQAASAYLDGLTAVGGTNINEALLTALRPSVPADTLPIVLFLTDGLPTVGVTGEKSIRDNILRANQTEGRRIFTFGVGNDVNVPLLTDLARETRGVPEFVAPEQDVEAAVGRVFDRLAGPVLTDLSISASTPFACGVEPVTDIFPRTPGDLFEKQRLIILGRFTDCPGETTIGVRGAGAGGESVRTISFDPKKADPANSHIARLWAKQKITWLIDEIQSASADPEIQKIENLRDDPRLAELIDEVVHLSTTYGILTEYTSFIAAEESMLAGVNVNSAELDRVLRYNAGQRSGKAAVDLAKSQLARRGAGGVVSGGAGSGSIDADGDGETQENVRALVDDWGVAIAAQTIEMRQANMQNLGSVVQQVGPDTLYNQHGRWVDANLVNADQQLANPAEDRPEPDETIAFGTERYFAVNFQLAETGRQALMAVPGEVEIMLDGKRLLIQNPS